jgi:hypothetical protein
MCTHPADKITTTTRTRKCVCYASPVGFVFRVLFRCEACGEEFTANERTGLIQLADLSSRQGLR